MHLSEDVVLYEKDKGSHLIINRLNGVRFQINDDMLYVIKGINNGSLDSRSLLDLGCSHVVDELLDLNIIDTKGKKSNYNVKKQIKDSFAQKTIEITNRCNLHCKHCCYDCTAIGSDMTWSMFNKLVELMDEDGTQSLILTGGEPMVHPLFINMLNQLNLHSIPTSLFTNLTLATDELMNLLKKYHVQKVVTSLESCDKNIHNKFRGDSTSFDRTVCSIKRLVNIGIPVEVNLVVGDHNYLSLNDTVEYIKSIGAKTKLDVLTPFGRAKNLPTNYPVIIDEINRMGLRYGADCGVCDRMLFIDVKGNVKICPSLEQIGNLGNVMENDFSFNSCRFQCDKLGLSAKLIKGCRARALLMSGDVYGPDPIFQELNHE